MMVMIMRGTVTRVYKPSPKFFFDDVADAIQVGAEAILVSSNDHDEEKDEE